MGLDTDFGRAFLPRARSAEASSFRFPAPCSFSVKDADKAMTAGPAAQLIAMGFRHRGDPWNRENSPGLRSAGPDHQQGHGGPPAHRRRDEKRRNFLVFNTTDGAQALADSSSIRKTALQMKIPYCTTMAAAAAVTQAIHSLKSGSLEVAPPPVLCLKTGLEPKSRRKR
jgi:carbamoyl-phosphate synthase large subunit